MKRLGVRRGRGVAYAPRHRPSALRPAAAPVGGDAAVACGVRSEMGNLWIKFSTPYARSRKIYAVPLCSFVDSWSGPGVRWHPCHGETCAREARRVGGPGPWWPGEVWHALEDRPGRGRRRGGRTRAGRRRRRRTPSPAPPWHACPHASDEARTASWRALRGRPLVSPQQGVVQPGAVRWACPAGQDRPCGPSAPGGPCRPAGARDAFSGGRASRARRARHGLHAAGRDGLGRGVPPPAVVPMSGHHMSRAFRA